MSSAAMNPAMSGLFATSRRGGLTIEDIRTAFELRSKRRSVQNIAAYLGRSTIDIAALFATAQTATECVQALVVEPVAPPARSGGKPLQYTPEQTALMVEVDHGKRSARSAAREIGCHPEAVRRWIIKHRQLNNYRQDRRPDGKFLEATF